LEWVVERRVPMATLFSFFIYQTSTISFVEDGWLTNEY